MHRNDVHGGQACGSLDVAGKNPFPRTWWPLLEKGTIHDHAAGASKVVNCVQAAIPPTPSSPSRPEVERGRP